MGILTKSCSQFLLVHWTDVPTGGHHLPWSVSISDAFAVIPRKMPATLCA